jgi:hypothetical protein
MAAGCHQFQSGPLIECADNRAIVSGDARWAIGPDISVAVPSCLSGDTRPWRPVPSEVR